MAGRDPKILLVEDTPTLAETYKAYLEPEGAAVGTAGTGEVAWEAIVNAIPDVIVLDVNLPDINGIDLLRRIKAEGLPIEVVVITGQASVSMAVEAMREGAFDFIMKPFTAERLRVTTRNALERRCLTRRIEVIDEEFARDRFQGFIGGSYAMQTVYRVLQSAAPTNATVFVTGESGTGKELSRSVLHDLSKRAGGPFISLNCAAIPRDLLESEIFGHSSAFTGAIAERRGAALCADKGTLFLDEVCEMDLSLQSKMLRFLQEKTVRRVGEDIARPADVRIVCATNRDPLKEVEAGRLREDLYYRLHVVPVELPPLRERDDDVLLIARHFLDVYSREDGKVFNEISPAAASLSRLFWPGNIRQLQNMIRTAIVLNDGKVLDIDMLPADLRAIDPAAKGFGREITPAGTTYFPSLNGLPGELESAGRGGRDQSTRFGDPRGNRKCHRTMRRQHSKGRGRAGGQSLHDLPKASGLAGARIAPSRRFRNRPAKRR